MGIKCSDIILFPLTGPRAVSVVSDAGPVTNEPATTTVNDDTHVFTTFYTFGFSQIFHTLVKLSNFILCHLA